MSARQPGGFEPRGHMSALARHAARSRQAIPGFGSPKIATPPPPSTDPDTLARQRATLGFDDIPVASVEESEHEKTLRNRVDSWAKEAYEHSKTPKRVTGFFKNKGYRKWKEDLQWALQADRGDDVPAETKPNPPPNVASDQWHQRPHYPQTTRQGNPRPRFEAPPRIRGPIRPITQTSVSSVEASAAKTIDINISFGALPKINFKALLAPLFRLLSTLWQRYSRLSKKYQILVGGSLIGLVLITLSVVYLPGIIGWPDSGGPSAPNTAGDTSPTYATLIPNGKTTATTAWQRVSPPDGNPVYAYVDNLDGVAIDVSQQPIPDSFQPNIDDNVAKLAKEYIATDKISAGSTPIYVGTSSQGPQSVIFTKNNLLVLIKSVNKISDDSWTKYVESLH